MKRILDREPVTLANGVRMDLLWRDETTFVGIGEVHAPDGTPLRSGRRPWSVRARTPDGVELEHWQALAREETPDGFLLTLRPQARPDSGGSMEWMLHTVRPRVRTCDWADESLPAASTVARLLLRPARRIFGTTEYAGFSWQWQYNSGDFPLYKMLDRGTWEVDGAAEGCEFWNRLGTGPSVTAFGPDPAQRYSSEWYLPGIPNPSIFQFLPWQTGMQGFSFTAHRRGTLVTWATDVRHIRSLFEKTAGRAEIAHLHEHCADLSGEFSTSPMEALWAARPASEADDFAARADRYEQVREAIHAHLHAYIGLRQERILPYSVIEEWTLPDMARYARVGVPTLLAAGVKTIALCNQFQNNMNVWGVSNMCCTVDLQIADAVGEDNVRDFCRRVHAGGARAEMWGNTALSTLSDIFDRPEGHAGRIPFLPRAGTAIEAAHDRSARPWVLNPSGAIEADHYTPVFCAVNLRDPVMAQFYTDGWRRLMERTGMDGIFVDSSFNMSSDKFHWQAEAHPARTGGATLDQAHLLGTVRPAPEPPAAILSQYGAYLDWIKSLQGMGYQIATEDIGVFGLGRSGPGLALRLPSLPLWGDTLCNFDFKELPDDADPDDVFFQGLAFRQMWYLYWNPAQDKLSFWHEGVRDSRDEPRPHHLTLLRAYPEADRHMTGRRRILPEGRGVVYEGAGHTALWSFRAQRVSLRTPAAVRDILAGKTLPPVACLEADTHRIYLLEGDFHEA